MKFAFRSVMTVAPAMRGTMNTPPTLIVEQDRTKLGEAEEPSAFERLRYLCPSRYFVSSCSMSATQGEHAGCRRI